MEQLKDILILGFGASGSRAAYTIFQRNTSENLRVMAADDDGESLKQLTGMSCVTLPPTPFNPDGFAAKSSKEALTALFSEQMSGVKMLCILAFLGGECSYFYSHLAMVLAASQSLPALVITTLPLAGASNEMKHKAREALEILQAQKHPVITLDCERFGALFPDSSPDAAYQQSLLWLADTASGYLKLLLQPRKSDTDDHDSEITEAEMEKMPLGIFAKSQPTTFNTRNLDIPTYLRKRITLP